MGEFMDVLVQYILELLFLSILSILSTSSHRSRDECRAGLI
jgi:hypothetical protein